MKPDTASLASFDRESLAPILRATNAFGCLECGKCTSLCPVSQYSRKYSPRRLLTDAIQNRTKNLLANYDLWSCLTCGRCESSCPADIHYMELMQHLRSSANQVGCNGKCSHSGAILTMQRMMTDNLRQQDRLGWLPDDLRITETGDILYFVGCSPYFDILFEELNPETTHAAIDSIRLLNKLGIEPVVMANEVCCGHDLLWNGDVDSFRKLAHKNAEAIAATGAKTMLFSCAECMSAFTELYPAHDINIKTKLLHMSQFLAQKINAGQLELAGGEKSVTYHDPCRLGRHMGIYDEPRQVLSHGNNGHYREMKQHGPAALCCGVSGWMNCDVTSKSMQAARLMQATSTGAETMVIGCPKCKIHLTCSMKDEALRKNFGVEIRDIATITLERMKH